MANGNNEEKIDYMSRLPDEILSVILSSLPIKLAVGTATLSKRWKYVWTKVPVIDFPKFDYIRLDTVVVSEQRKRYNAFLNRVVLLSDVSCLERFAINYNIFDDESLDAINLLLDVIRKRHFCELDIDLSGKLAPLPLPREFLSSHRLVDLKLDGFCVDDSQMWSFYLPNLETVYFGGCFVFQSDEFLRRFVLACPVLKNLKITCGHGLGHIYVESSTLVSLEIRNLPSDKIRITIKASNLRYLNMYYANAHYIIDDLNLLIDANILLTSVYGTSDSIDDNLIELVEKVSRATTLRLVMPHLHRYVVKLPKFENLTQLNLSNDGCAYELLKRAPKLKTLILDNLRARMVNKFWNFQVAPECLSCLERVELLWLDEGDTKVAEYFLKTGTALKDMILKVSKICGTEGITIESCRALRQRLLDFPTLSPICKLQVFYYNLRSCILIA